MNDTERKAQRMIQGATSRLLLKEGFFGVLASNGNTIISEGIKTAATNGIDFMYNPDFVCGLPMGELVGLCLHEVLHKAWGHCFSIGNRDAGIHNNATDYHINSIIVANGYKLPEGALLDSRFNGMNSDKIYQILYDEKQNKQKGEAGSMPGEAPKSQEGHPKNSAPLQPWGNVEKPKDDKGEPITGSDLTKVINQNKVQVKQAAAIAKKSGGIPMGISELLKDIEASPVSCLEILEDLIGDIAEMTYSYDPPDLQMMDDLGVVAPDIDWETSPVIAMVFDTSGSVTSVDKKYFAQIVTDLVEKYNAIVHVMYVDTMVERCEVFAKDDVPLEFHPKGGGGTNFSGVQKYMEDNDIEAELLIYLSDMSVRNWGDEPGCQTIGVCTRPVWATVPKWLEVHYMKDDI